LIGSADLRVRNLDRRIEAVVPVVDVEAQARLTEMLEVELADDVDTWVLGPDGDWSRVPTIKGLSAQRQLQEMAVERARRRREMETLTQIRRP
jgi:polyphosphate kinase